MPANVPLDRLVAYMQEKGIQEIRVDKLVQTFGKNHGMKKKLIDREGGERGLRWDDSDSKNMLVVRDEHSPPPPPQSQVQDMTLLDDVTFSVVSERYRIELSIDDFYKYFYVDPVSNGNHSDARQNYVLFGESLKSEISCSYGYFGTVIRNSTNKTQQQDTSNGADEYNAEPLYLNVSEPFCALCVGVQGSGKSHTANVLLENCFINMPYPPNCPVTSLNKPQCGLVLHYDQNSSSVCESTGIGHINDSMKLSNVTGVERMVILVSPSYYHQRKHFYKGTKFEVHPLLFKWSSLSAEQLKKLMRLNKESSQLYVSVMLDLLRSYQRDCKMPNFKTFINDVMEKIKSPSQSAPMEQRLQLLHNFVEESDKNSKLISDSIDPISLLKSGVLVVADLTDPFLSSDEVNGIFQVLLQQFRDHNLEDVGKVVVFDEAHRYLSSADSLSETIVETVRLMRHDGIRVIVSSQSPLALPSELLELVSFTVLHHFQSKDWFQYLSTKIPVPDNGFEIVKKLKTGQSLTVSTKMAYNADVDSDHAILKVRPRITADYGASRTVE